MTEILPTLVFGGIALFLAIRLYSVLGRREGHMEEPNQHTRSKPVSVGADDGAASHLRPAFEGPAAAGLEAIAGADRGFDPDRFVEGARSAYEMIVVAFANGDKDQLRSLLSDDVFSRYVAAIDARIEKGETVKTEIERIVSVEISDAVLEGSSALVTVAFEADIATETRDQDGVLISGDIGRLARVSENWVFERDTQSRDPNWILTRVSAA